MSMTLFVTSEAIMSQTTYPDNWYNEATDKKESFMVAPDLPPIQAGGGCGRKIALTFLVFALMALSFELGAYFALVRLCAHC